MKHLGVVVASTLLLGVATGCDSASVEYDPVIPFPLTVAAQPLLTLGGIGAPEAELFGVVRTVSFLGPDRIAVPDAQQDIAKVFTTDGTLVMSLGDPDGGPGYLEGIIDVRPYRGDSIAVMDHWRQTISIFDPAGVFARSVQLRFDNGYTIHPPRAMSDGRFLVWSPHRMVRGPSLDSSWVLLAAPDGDVVDTLTRIPITQRDAPDDPSNNESIGTVLRGGAVAGRGERVVVGWPSRFQLHALDLSGAPVADLRLRRPPILNSSEVLESERNRRLEECIKWGTSEERCESRYRLRQITLPDTLPAFWHDVIIDDVGRTWVGLPPQLGVNGREVFGQTGEYLGRVELPETFTLFDVNGDRLLGIRMGDLGVQQVVLLELENGAS